MAQARRRRTVSHFAYRYVAADWVQVDFCSDVDGTTAAAVALATSIAHDKVAIWLDQWAEGKCASRDMIPMLEQADGRTRAWLRVVVHKKYAAACRSECAYG